MNQQRGSQRSQRRPIVVGVDGSPGSKAALRWALDQAGQNATTVDAIIVWAPQATCCYGYGWVPVTVADDDLAGAAETILLDTLVEVTREHGRSVPITPRVVRGQPVEELLAAARSARLLVLGAPTHGTVAGLLRGSVSRQCLRHAPCPVVITPASPSRPAERRLRAAVHSKDRK